MNPRDIYLIHGTDYKAMTKRLLERADLAGDIGDRSRRIALKPNLVCSKPPSSGATTHPELLCGLIEYLRENGFCNLVIMEGSWVGDQTLSAYQAAGYQELSRKYQVPFIDLQKDSSSEYDAAGMKLRMCDEAARADYMVNLPVLKGHCQTSVTCALKNYKGIIPNGEKRRYHTMGLHRPIAHLSTIVPKGLILVDNICGDLDFEEGGNPVVMNRILGFWDPVLCDAFACRTMGYSVDQVPYITMAEKLGSGSSDLENANFISLNEDIPTQNRNSTPRRVEKLASFIDARDACSACYGSLIYALSRLEESGQLRGRKAKISIGQGFCGQTGEIGVGECTSCFAKSLKGCPPNAARMTEFLKNHWK